MTQSPWVKKQFKLVTFRHKVQWKVTYNPFLQTFIWQSSRQTVKMKEPFSFLSWLLRFKTLIIDFGKKNGSLSHHTKKWKNNSAISLTLDKIWSMTDNVDIENITIMDKGEALKIA